MQFHLISMAKKTLSAHESGTCIISSQASNFLDPHLSHGHELRQGIHKLNNFLITILKRVTFWHMESVSDCLASVHSSEIITYHVIKICPDQRSDQQGNAVFISQNFRRILPFFFSLCENLPVSL